MRCGPARRYGAREVSRLGDPLERRVERTVIARRERWLPVGEFDASGARARVDRERRRRAPPRARREGARARRASAEGSRSRERAVEDRSAPAFCKNRGGRRRRVEPSSFGRFFRRAKRSDGGRRHRVLDDGVLDRLARDEPHIAVSAQRSAAFGARRRRVTRKGGAGRARREHDRVEEVGARRRRDEELRRGERGA